MKNNNNKLPSSFLSHRENFITTFDHILDHIVKDSFPNMGINVLNNAYPKVNIISFPDKIRIEAEIAGMNEKDINIELENEILTISGAKKEETVLPEGAVYIYKELKRSNFKRSFTVSKEEFEVNEIKANFKDSLLTLDIPKLNKEVKTVKKIELNNK